MTQRTKFKIAVYVLLFVIACILLVWFLSFASARSRDYQRLSDLKQIQSEFTQYFSKTNNYKIDCQLESLISKCQADGVNFSTIKDPLNGGIYKYTILDLSESDFQIKFAIETKVGGLNPGEHIFGKEGVIK